MLEVWRLSDQSAVVLDGWLQKRGRFTQQWHWRYCRLTACGKLQTFQGPHRSDSSGAGAGAVEGDDLTGEMDLRGATASAADFTLAASAPFGFQVVSSDQLTFRLSADCPQVRVAWVESIIRLSASCTAAADAAADAAAAAAAAADIAIAAVPTPQPASAAEDRESPSGDGRGGDGRAGAGAGGDAGTKGKGKGKGPGAPPPPKAGAGKGGKGKGPGEAPPPKAGKAKSALSKPMPKPLGNRTIGVRCATGAAANAPAEAFRLPSLDSDDPDALLAGSTGGGSSSSTARPSLNLADIDLGALQIFAPKEQFQKEQDVGSARTSPRRIELLPRDVAQNVAIVLRKLHTGTAALAEALRKLAPSECELGPEEAERLVHVLPKPDMLHRLAFYGSADGEDPRLLRDIERDLLPLAELSRLTQRLRLLVLDKTLSERLQDAVKQMSMLQAACSACRRSGLLRDLLQVILVLFNYVTFGEVPLGEAAGGARRARNVDVKSLLRLRETSATGGKGPFPRYNMLHYCVEQLQRQRPELSHGDIARELGALPAAAGVSLTQLHRGLDWLREELAFARAELEGHRSEYETKTEFVSEPAPPPPAPPPTQEPEPVTKPDGPLEFSMVEAEAVAEERAGDVASGSGHGLPWRRGSHPMKYLVGRGLDLVKFLEEWRHGDAVAGTADHHSAPATLSADDEPPPPGVLWRMYSLGEWRKCWCEVRSTLLVIYSMDDNCRGILGTYYVALPGAEVFEFDSLCASMRARSLADVHPHGFEVWPAGDARKERLRASSAAEATKWIDFLNSQARQHRGGHLSLHTGGWRLLSSSWERLYCVCQRPGELDGSLPAVPQLLGFARTRDCAEGRPPLHVWPLGAATVRALTGEGASASAERLAQHTPMGFEVEDYETGKCWQFACDSWGEQNAWMEVLGPQLDSEFSSLEPQVHTLYESFRVTRDPEVDRRQLFDLFDDGSASSLDSQVPPSTCPSSPAGSPLHLEKDPSEEHGQNQLKFSFGPLPAACGKEIDEEDLGSQSTGDGPEAATCDLLRQSSGSLDDGSADEATPSSDEEGPSDALSQLRRLQRDADAAASQWSRTLSATEADCRGLLRFFGLDAQVPSDARTSRESSDALALAVSQLLEALSAFCGQVGDAWLDLEKHRNNPADANMAASKSRRRLSSRRSTTASSSDGMTPDGVRPVLGQ